MLKKHENALDFPFIDKEFIMNIFRVITVRENKAGKPISEDNIPRHNMLLEFYNDVYLKDVQKELLLYDLLKSTLQYSAKEMITNINNNITEHFQDHIVKFLKVNLNLASKIKEIKQSSKTKQERKERLAVLFSWFNSMRDDVLFYTEQIKNTDYLEYIRTLRYHLFNNIYKYDKDYKTTAKLERINEANNFNYHVKKNPQMYLYGMISLGKLYETYGIPPFNALPLQTELVPRHISLDNEAMIKCLFESTGDNKSQAMSDYSTRKIEYWNRFFKLESKEFKKTGYTFDFHIKTDGVSCSILFEPLDENGNVIPKKKRNNKNAKKQAELNNDNVKHIEDVVWKNQEREFLKTMSHVCIDPGKQDLIHCGNYQNGNFINYRYTQAQRKFETKSKKYQKDREKLKKKYPRVQFIENILSKFNSKTNDYEKFKQYCIVKNDANNHLRPYYEKRFFRKLKLYAHINVQKSEAKMLNDFQKKFGGPKKTYIILGDWCKSDHTLKGNEPTINKKFRRLFVSRGYRMYLINEFRTSKLCNGCGNELEKFHYREKSKKIEIVKLKKVESQQTSSSSTSTSSTNINWTSSEIKQSEKVLCHGLLRCNSSEGQNCQTKHNRDKNAVKNMLIIVKSLFETGKRPEKFRRGNIAAAHSAVSYGGVQLLERHIINKS